MKKILLLCLVVLPLFAFSQSLDEMRKQDALKKEYLEELKGLLALSEQNGRILEKCLPQHISMEERNKIAGFDLTEWVKNKNYLILSPFEDIGNSIFKEHYKPDFKRIEDYMKKASHAESVVRKRKSKYIGDCGQDYGIQFYKNVLENYKITKYIMTLLKSMTW